MGDGMYEIHQNFRDAKKAAVESLAKMIASTKSMTVLLKAGSGDACQILTLARFDDPEPTAAILLRLARLERASADAHDELRLAMVEATSRVEWESGGGE